MNRSLPVLPVPEIIENNLSHSFKQFNRNDYKKSKKPPKLYPKHDVSISRVGQRDAQAISFKNQLTPIVKISKSNFLKRNSLLLTSTPVRNAISLHQSPSKQLFSSYYDRNRPESYFEQCFEQVKKIGEGSFAEVFKVKSREDGKYYAVKKTKQLFRSECCREERLEEVRRYEQFSENEHCVTLYKAWEENDLLYMQIELCKNSLEAYVEEMKIVPESFVWSFLLDMLLAVKSLHDQNLVHLDIKLDNILITNGDVCKLADFGLVFDLNSNNRSRAIEGDSRYLAPELMQGEYCLANDIFSLGITTLELASNLELPANGALWQQLRTSIYPEDIMKSVSTELKTVIVSMMEPNHQLRPTVDILLKNPTIMNLQLQRNVRKTVKKCLNYFSNSFRFVLNYIVRGIFFLFNIFKLNNDKRNIERINNTTPARSGIHIKINHYDENSDDEISLKTSSLNNSRVSRISGNDEDSNVTPTLNVSIPRVTPDVKIINSTPLNHNSNGSHGFSNRKFRRDLKRSGFESDGLFSPDNSPRNTSQNKDTSSIICKKLFFHDDDLDDL